MATGTHTITFTEMRVLICGSRYWDDYDAVMTVIDHLIEQATRFNARVVVIQGGAKGADSLACRAALERKLEVEQYDADWKTYGRSAGPIRNKRMLDEGKPSLVVAFSYDLANSKGTANMVAQAGKAGITTVVIGREETEQVQQELFRHIEEIAGEDT